MDSWARDGEYTFYPVVAFKLPGGELVEARSSVGSVLLPPKEHFREGATVSVLYDPAKPTRIEVAGFEHDGFGMRLFLSGTSGMLAVIALLEMVV